jgi:kinesin family protein 15
MDLLEPLSFNLHVREDMKKGVYVEGLLEEIVSSNEDMATIMARGAANRKVGSTSMNSSSSRSHSVLTTQIESKTMTPGGIW